MRNEAGETVLLTRHPVMWGRHPLLFAGCVLLSLGGIGLIFLLVWMRRCRAVTLTVTNRRTILRYDGPNPQTIQVRHGDVRLVEVRSGSLQKLLGTGNLNIGSVGHAAWELEVAGLRSPEQVAGVIRRYREQAVAE